MFFLNLFLINLCKSYFIFMFTIFLLCILYHFLITRVAFCKNKHDNNYVLKQVRFRKYNFLIICEQLYNISLHNNLMKQNFMLSMWCIGVFTLGIVYRLIHIRNCLQDYSHQELFIGLFTLGIVYRLIHIRNCSQAYTHQELFIGLFTLGIVRLLLFRKSLMHLIYKIRLRRYEYYMHAFE